jgi:hypothetical protein
MATLTRRWSWKKWAPDIGENRELEGGPVLFLELAAGLTAEQLEGVFAAIRTADTVDGVRAAMAEALTPYVRVFEGPHAVDGQPLATFGDYVALVSTMADRGLGALRDLSAALTSFNSLAGPDELFSLRSSGGARSTGDQRPAKAAKQTGAR